MLLLLGHPDFVVSVAPEATARMVILELTVTFVGEMLALTWLFVQQMEQKPWSIPKHYPTLNSKGEKKGK